MVAGACACLWPGWSLESQVWALMAPLPKVSVKLHPSFCLLKEKLPLEHPKCCLRQGVHQLARISCGDARVTCPRHGGDDGCTVSQDMVAVHIGNCSLRCSGTARRQSVAGPREDGSTAGLGLGLSHWAPPCWLTHSRTFHHDCDTCSYAQVCLWVRRWYCIAHPSPAENSITPH